MHHSCRIGLAISVCWMGLAASPPRGQPHSLDELAFMAGCWRGPAGGTTVIEEYYSTPSNNLMVGTTRYLRDGRTVMFEFTQITADSTGIFLLPYPRGRPSEDAFRLTVLQSGRAVFEAPEHDFPKRIIYRSESADVRIARIDGGAGSTQVQEWRMERVSCESRVEA